MQVIWHYSAKHPYRQVTAMATSVTKGGSHHGPWSWTMEDGLFHGPTSWFDFHGQTSWSDFHGPTLDFEINLQSL
jgi:hypothetical protein